MLIVLVMLVALLTTFLRYFAGRRSGGISCAIVYTEYTWFASVVCEFSGPVTRQICQSNVSTGTAHLGGARGVIREGGGELFFSCCRYAVMEGIIRVLNVNMNT